MLKIINVKNEWHLGDNIINFIFFYKIKDYIEYNNIFIHYYCLKQYHTNLSEFNCSKNIFILELTKMNYSRVTTVLWQGGDTPNQHFIEDTLCGMFNIFLQKYSIPIRVSSFEYQDPELFTRYTNLENKYKNIDILVINSTPLSSQYLNYNKYEWDNFIIRLNKKYKIAIAQKVNNDILSLHDMSVKNIAALALNVKKIIAINTGPSIPLYNTDILNNVEIIYLFGNTDGKNLYHFKTRKIKLLNKLHTINFLL